MDGAREVLLGFDARRIERSGYREKLPIDYRLRTEVEDILSVDTMVWPSAVLDAPSWIGPNAPFWEDLDRLRSAPLSSGANWIIAAAWRSLGQEATKYGPYPEPTRPGRIDPAWTFLGFDIADPGISGLSNCGYGQERQVLATEWGPHLNRYHLFEDLDRAFAFRAITNARVPEHAPFFVIGLWLIAST
jgi:hypothetical protein